MLAEACGGRTHQPVISGFAGFEDQEGHRAHSASALPEDSGGSEILSSYFGAFSRYLGRLGPRESTPTVT